MAVLPSRPGSARFGRERLTVDRSHAPGELAALPADPAAAGTTVSRSYSSAAPRGAPDWAPRRRAGGVLGACWGRAGRVLAACWGRAGRVLGACWPRAGGVL